MEVATIIREKIHVWLNHEKQYVRESHTVEIYIRKLINHYYLFRTSMRETIVTRFNQTTWNENCRWRGKNII